MNQGQALELAGALYAAWPGRTVPESTLLLAAGALIELDDQEAGDVVALLQLRCPDPPSLHQIHETTAEVRKETSSPRPALPVGEFMEQMPAEVRTKVDELQASWAEDGALDRAELDREWERRKAAILVGPKMHEICAGAGRAPVRQDGSGKLICPGCGVEVPDLLVRLPDPRGARS